MTLVFERSRTKGSARLVLLALADVANDDGEVTAYKRSHGILAVKANVDEGTVPRALAKCRALGELEILTVGDGRRQSDYRITLADEGAQSAPPQSAPGETAERAGRDRESHPQGEPDAPPIIPSSSVTSVPSVDLDTAAFEEWWKAYPRKIGKPAARKAYGRALKKTTPTVLLEAAKRYATARAGEDATYTKHPGPWLNDERWNDDPAPARGKRRPANLDNFDNSQTRRAQPGGEIKFKPGARSA